MSLMERTVDFFCSFQFQLFFVEMLFCFQKGRKSHFLLRFVSCLLLFFLPTFVHPNDIDWTKAVVGNFFALGCIWLFFLSVGVELFCFDITFKEGVFFASAGFAFFNFYSGIRHWILFLFPYRNVPIDFALSLVLFFVWLAVFYWLTVRRKKTESFYMMDSAFLFLWLVILINYTFHLWTNLWQLEEEQANNLANAMSILCSGALLILQFGILLLDKLRKDKEFAEQLLAVEEKQRKISEEMMEVINIKCHDIKHQMSVLYERGGVVDRAWMDELSQAITSYRAVVNTGNSALDSVLAGKILLCSNHKIRFSYMVDAKDLRVMKAADIYSLFGNALENAIECELRMEESKRNISLNIRREACFLSIHLDNYCNEDVAFVDGQPVSHKKDLVNHGFGFKSIAYIVQKYNGNVTVQVKNDCFMLDILIPVNP